ncbi:MAG: hypothetical protein RMH97_03115, partial [Verrucomicrobiales bacterium]|nr:hypothetical protein [Verrucomicrobiales bacterium]
KKIATIAGVGPESKRAAAANVSANRQMHYFMSQQNKSEVLVPYAGTIGAPLGSTNINLSIKPLRAGSSSQNRR